MAHNLLYQKDRGSFYARTNCSLADGGPTPLFHLRGRDGTGGGVEVAMFRTVTFYSRYFLKCFQEMGRMLVETWWLWVGIALFSGLVAVVAYVSAVFFLGVK